MLRFEEHNTCSWEKLRIAAANLSKEYVAPEDVDLQFLEYEDYKASQHVLVAYNFPHSPKVMSSY